MSKLARTTVKPGRPREPLGRRQIQEDDYLDTDSEVDEFATPGAGPSGSGSSDVDQSEGDEDESDEGEDGVGQWEPDDWQEGDEGGSGSDSGDGSGSEEEQEEDVDEAELQDNLRQIPLATLAKAHKSLRQSQASQSTRSTGTDVDKVELMKARLAEMQRLKGKGKGKAAVAVAQAQREAAGMRRSEADDDDESDSNEGGGRSSKHAPAVMSTKRQVSRHRQAISIPKREVRDPRFSSVSGSLNPHLHSQAYDFLPQLFETEFAELKKAVVAATKAERSCPLREKPARTADRERLELELGRMRSRIDRAKGEKREREVLAQVKKQERDKRSEGKGAWYMKKGEKRDLLLKARFDALEQEGGKRAVKKAVDKKRKKVAGREKRSRPDGPGGAPVRKRSRQA